MSDREVGVVLALIVGLLILIFLGFAFATAKPPIIPTLERTCRETCAAHPSADRWSVDDRVHCSCSGGVR